MNQYLPKNRKVGTIKYMAIAAHQDDIEILGYHGILNAYLNEDISFVGVVTSDGAGSARTGEYEFFTDEQMKEVRIKEQKEASEIGQYEAIYFLNYSSKHIKNKNEQDIVKEYIELIKKYRPHIIYTHNIFDRHPTHLGVVTKVIKALQYIDEQYKPQILYGVEVWRDLDWLNDEDKVLLDVGGNEKLELDLLNVYKSQIQGGKRYDLATLGRRRANATYSSSHDVDNFQSVNFAINLTTLMQKEASIRDFVINKIDKFKVESVFAIEKIC